MSVIRECGSAVGPGNNDHQFLQILMISIPRKFLLPTITRSLFLTTSLFILQPAIGADAPAQKSATDRPYARSVMEYGAVGDGIADDTAAVQRALNAANLSGSVLQFPAGLYRITSTLDVGMTSGRGLIIEGAGGRPIEASGFDEKKATTTFVWDGEEGGVLMLATGVSGLVIRDLSFDGSGKKGVLFKARHIKGWGNMLNMMENVHFYRAATGIQMGSEQGEHTNSDYAFHYLTFRSLDNGLLVKNDQGVDFLFNYIFALSVKTVLNFERGGNLLVNNAQMTNCPLFLNIEGGGRNVGTYIASNVRIEWDKAGTNRRGQLLRSTPKYKQAVVRFTGFTDAQWGWPSNQTESRGIPLMEIGPGTSVVMESSLLSGPLARISGTPDNPATFILRSSSFSNGRPEDFVAAMGDGFFKLQDNYSDKMVLWPDAIRWPDIAPIKFSPSDLFTGKQMSDGTPSEK